MTDSVKLLGPPINFAVVQLPERRYPGVVVQGDTLEGMVDQLNRMRNYLDVGELNELRDEISELSDILSNALAYFRKICEESSSTDFKD